MLPVNSLRLEVHPTKRRGQWSFRGSQNFLAKPPPAEKLAKVSLPDAQREAGRTAAGGKNDAARRTFRPAPLTFRALRTSHFLDLSTDSDENRMVGLRIASVAYFVAMIGETSLRKTPKIQRTT